MVHNAGLGPTTPLEDISRSSTATSAARILAFEGDSHVEFFQGKYREQEEDRKRRLGAEGAQPHRLRFKALK